MVLETGLKGAHVLITGGTKGIGKSMVETFLREEANVSYCARNVTGDEFSSFKSTLPASNSARAIGTSVDVSNKEALVAWVNASQATFSRTDVVIANASPLSMDGDTAAWHLGFGVDLMGFVELVPAVEPYLEKSPLANIIVVSSFMGREYFRGPPAAYGALKAAQLQHVQELSHHLGPKGIRVNAISPGPITFPGGAWDIGAKTNPEWVEAQRVKVALRRLGGPQEMANVAVWLASPLASYVAGANILADGGIHVGTSF